MLHLPADDSTRVISFVTPFANYVGCYASSDTDRKDKSRGGNPDDDGQGKCGKDSGAEEKIFPKEPRGGKGLDATLQDFQAVRQKCFELQENGGLLASSGSPKKKPRGCDFVNRYAPYFNRDNGKKEISLAIHGSGGYEFNSQYQNDRQRSFNGMGKLPGNEYCNGPHDRLSKDGGTKFCACAPDGRTEEHPGGDFSKPGLIKRKRFVDLSKIEVMTEGAVPQDVPRVTWTGQWESMTWKERDDHLMLQSFRDLNINWWGRDETVEYRDQDPCRGGTGTGTGTGTSATGNATSSTTAGEDESDGSSSASSCGSSESFLESETHGMLKLPGQSRQGDFTKAVYEFYGPLVSKIIDMDHGGDLSKVAFFATSEGGSMMFELPLYLMHRKIMGEVAAQKENGVRTPGDLAAKVLNTPKKRRPFCVGGTWGSDTMPRPESIQGKHNWRRLRDTAAICGDLMKWSNGLNTMVGPTGKR
eukprot:g10192.t1